MAVRGGGLPLALARVRRSRRARRLSQGLLRHLHYAARGRGRSYSGVEIKGNEARPVTWPGQPAGPAALSEPWRGLGHALAPREPALYRLACGAGVTVESLCPRACGRCPPPAGGGRPAAAMETALGEEEALEPRQERALAAARDWVRQAGGTSSTPSSSRRAPPPPHVLTALSEAAWRRSHLALEVRARVQVRVIVRAIVRVIVRVRVRGT